MAASLQSYRLASNIQLFRSLRAGLVTACKHASTSTADSTKTWQLHSAVCLQRYPILSAQPNPVEQQFQQYLNQAEINDSFLSDYEMQEIEEKRMKAKIAKMSEEEKKKLDEKSLQTLEEIQDEQKKELDAFPFADRLTDADRNKDDSTHNQKLDKKLVLIVKQRWSDQTEPKWCFPQSCRLDGESMREAAERTLNSTCGETIDALFVGNAPCGHFKYKLPPNHGGTEYGVKAFFFKANHHGGDVVRSDNIIDHKWVTFDALPKYFEERYFKVIKNIFALSYI